MGTKNRVVGFQNGSIHLVSGTEYTLCHMLVKVLDPNNGFYGKRYDPIMISILHALYTFYLAES